MIAAALIAHAAATVFMTGLVWFVQVVHYPLHREVGTDSFAAYQRAHLARTGWVVGPPMAVEAVSATVLALRPAPGVPAALGWMGLALLAVVWGSTWGLQVPAHRALERLGKHHQTLGRLVRTNWLRTLAWTARSVLALAMLWLGARAAGGAR